MPTETRRAPTVPKSNTQLAERTERDFGNMSSPPPPSDYPVDRGPEVVATTLAPQLGSNAKHLSEGDFDMRKLSIIESKDIPFLIYAKIRSKKSKSWGSIYEEFLNLQVSIGGRGRRDIIRMEGVSKGGMPDMSSEIEKPGWLERNVTDRAAWKKQKQDQMM